MSEVGGGIVKGFQGKGIVLIEDEDGFDIPMSEREVVVIDTDDYNIAVPPTKEEEPSARQPQRTSRASQNDDDDEMPDIELPPLEVAGNDKLNVTLAFVPEDVKMISATSFDAYLVNDSNYFLYYIYASGNNATWRVRSHGLVEPNMKAWMESFMQSDLNDMERVCLQMVAFKKEKFFELIPAIDVRLRLDTTKFFKMHCFGETDFFETPALLYPIVEDNVAYRQHAVPADELAKEMMRKKSHDEHEPARVVKTATPKADEKVVTDLHIAELLDSTEGLSNAEMLEVQMNRFRSVMKEYAGKHGRHLIFIHGKGEGVLRKAILDELNRRHRNECLWQDASFKEYGYGATEVVIK